jgi:uncharacterized membrane protein YgdD (TMEM256/DUF423 family)
MSRFFLVSGAVLAGVAVAAGAFGAHGLEGRVSPDRIETFRTGVTYHMWHALALLFVGGWSLHDPGALTAWAGGCFLAGIVLFSGSLYVLVLTDTPWLGAVTPFGGVAFLAGWGLVVWSVWTGA